jgi:hypothetical protein
VTARQLVDVAAFLRAVAASRRAEACGDVEHAAEKAARAFEILASLPESARAMLFEG